MDLTCWVFEWENSLILLAKGCTDNILNVDILDNLGISVKKDYEPCVTKLNRIAGTPLKVKSSVFTFNFRL